MSTRHCSRLALATGIFFLLFIAGLRAWSPGTGDPSAIQGFTVDTTNRNDVLSFYNAVYTASQSYPADVAWTGNIASGIAGTTSATFKDDVNRRVNFYRALAGLPGDITFSDTDSSNDQQAALMFSVNNQISHYPPTNWTDYTTIGATAAGSSNISIGSYGPGSVDAFMVDNGSNNMEVGHRRWLLYPLEQTMGTGDVPFTGSGFYDGVSNFNAANAIWVFDTFKTSAPEQFISWPNSGYCPLPLIPARWSLSYPNADFTHAAVTMTQGGSSVPCTVTYADSPASLGGSIVGDNTIVWTPTSLPTTLNGDATYTVTVTGISDDRSTNDTWTYNVTLFDPNVLGQSVSISGSATPSTTGATYTFNAISEADAYHLQVSTGSTAVWDEGAEDSPTPQIIADTTGSYPLRQTSLVHTGLKAFQLTFPGDIDTNSNYESYDFSNQSFQITRQIVPTATSQLQFWDRCRYAATTETLSAQVSTDSGNTWTTVWSRNGVGESSANWDSAFIQNNVSLASYAGQIVLVQFVLNGNGDGVVLGTDSTCGFFIDDITVTNSTQLVNSTTTTLSGSATSFTLNTATAGAALQAGTSYYLLISPEVGLKWYSYGAFNIVTAQTPTVTGYSTWISTLYPAVTGGVNGDYSGDGIANGYKYAFGLNPTVHNSPAAIPAPVITGSSMTLSYTVPSGIAGVTYSAESSTDLFNWTAIPNTGTGNNYIFTISTTGHQRLFIRHLITIAP